MSAWRNALRGPRLVLLMLAAAPAALGATAATASASLASAAFDQQTADSGAMRMLLLRQVDFWLLHGKPERAAYALNRLLRLNPSNTDAARLLAGIRSEQDAETDARVLAPGPIWTVQDDTTEPPLPTPVSPMPLPAAADPLTAPASPADPSAEAEAAEPPPAPPRRSPRPPPEPIDTGDELTVDRALLRRDPTDMAVRQQAFRAALRLGDRATAMALASDALRLDADDPRAWAMAADLDHANGIPMREAQERQTARSLQLRQRADAGEQEPTHSAAAEAISANPDITPPPQSSGLAEAAIPGSAEPDNAMSATPQAVQSDPLSSEIDRRISAVATDLATKVYIGPYLLYRSGTSGLNQLVDVAPKMEASFSPGGTGTLTVDVIPTFLDAGRLPTARYTQFATAALNSSPLPSTQTAAGVGLDAAYAYGWFKADLGATPLGFARQNVLGGIELSPRLAGNLTLHILGERRPVAESLLSYAGTTDPRTGATWGAVMQNRAYARLDLAVGIGELHGGGGYDWLGGTNVKFNHAYEIGAGGSYPILRTENGELRAGAELSYFSYAKNLNQFTFGQGGYFSPQSYVAGVIPLRYSETDDQFKWSVAGQIGYQSYRQGASPYFAGDGVLQSQLESAVAAGNATTAFFAGNSTSGVVGGGSGSFEYNITPVWVFGAQAGFQYAEDYSDAEATVFTRYILGGGAE